MSDSTVAELLALNRRLLDSIMAGDWKAYSELCDESLTAFEPEAAGQLVAGLPFHKYYFDLGAGKGPRQATMCSAQVRLLGDAAVVSYVRLNQKLDTNGQPVTSAVEETRIWHKSGGQWKHVHFHRSPAK
jgi:ketosteroid isomerase-like protein